MKIYLGNSLVRHLVSPVSQNLKSGDPEILKELYHTLSSYEK